MVTYARRFGITGAGSSEPDELQMVLAEIRQHKMRADGGAIYELLSRVRERIEEFINSLARPGGADAASDVPMLEGPDADSLRRELTDLLAQHDIESAAWNGLVNRAEQVRRNINALTEAILEATEDIERGQDTRVLAGRLAAETADWDQLMQDAAAVYQGILAIQERMRDIEASIGVGN